MFTTYAFWDVYFILNSLNANTHTLQVPRFSDDDGLRNCVTFLGLFYLKKPIVDTSPVQPTVCLFSKVKY